SSPEASRRNCRRTCRRTAGLGQPRPAFPGADDDVIARDNMCERDIRTFGKNRMVLKKRTEALKVASVDVVNPEDRMRIAHAYNRRRAQHRLVDGTNLQLDRARVAELPGKWDLVPLEAWHTHIDREQPVGILPAIEYARRRFKGERILSALLCHQVCDTSHAVTSVARLPTI